MSLKVGDECPSCADKWDNEELPRRRLVGLGTTLNKKLTVTACPFCDGERLIEIHKSRKK